mmetsp:Transcript_48255/g.134722  ORF Transcript_48255/g.134722 Transcript_48255/m.134722 type:complete len:200 (-) Transcript_48255:1024-1623(-)
MVSALSLSNAAAAAAASPPWCSVQGGPTSNADDKMSKATPGRRCWSEARTNDCADSRDAAACKTSRIFSSTQAAGGRATSAFPAQGCSNWRHAPTSSSTSAMTRAKSELRCMLLSLSATSKAGASAAASNALALCCMSSAASSATSDSETAARKASARHRRAASLCATAVAEFDACNVLWHASKLSLAPDAADAVATIS